MEMIASLIAGLGIFCGVFLAFISPEELKPGKKYFTLLHHIMLTAIIILIAVSFFTQIRSMLILSLIFIYGLPAGTLLARRHIKKRWHQTLLLTLIPYLIIVMVSYVLL